MKSKTTINLEISLIVRDPEIQPREVMNHDAVTQYAEDMLAGIDFPPVVAFHDGERYWLSQGFHRCEAAIQSGLEVIPTDVRQGTRQDALWDAAGSNKEHDTSGLRRTNADKRRAVLMALEARPDLSSRAISQQVGVHHSTVVCCRNPTTDAKRVGIDGRKYLETKGRKPKERPEPKIDESEDTESEPFSLDIVPADIATEIEPATKSKFNQTNEMVDWARWTWNPVTGCEHNCVYCYARDIANRFYPEKFTPTYRPERLTAPECTIIPAAAKSENDPVSRTAWRNVFVCSMADLFGRWVPDEWIDGVFEACCRTDRWNYLFLTKFPKRYVGLDFPPNSWVGTSVDEQKRVANAETAFAKIDTPIKWLSVEPMLEPIVFNDLSMFDWVVIGGQSRSTGAPEFHPESEWVWDLVKKAWESGCKVYQKPNLFKNWGSIKPIKEYPF